MRGRTETKTILKDDLYSQYNWFYKSFSEPLQTACDEFLPDFFSFHLISLGKNINILQQGDEFFVTKIRFNKKNDVFFRCSADAVEMILDKLFGKNSNFIIENISELEAKIISSFSNHLYNSILPFLGENPSESKTDSDSKHSRSGKNKTADLINLTFFIRDKEADRSAKLIISIPQALLLPISQKHGKEVFDISDFKTSKVTVNIQAGTTLFALKELKNLEKEDIVIFDNSNIHSMKLIYEDYEQDFKIAPNPGLVTSINGGDNMVQEKILSQDLWDNIQVEMSAEFEKVKITLGELKSIEEGLVVDINSVYNNKISLKVENKIIARGELIIINDRYGVRIDKVLASEKEIANPLPIEEETDAETLNAEETDQAEVSAPEEEDASKAEEEFDYSDFELENQDI